MKVTKTGRIIVAGPLVLAGCAAPGGTTVPISPSGPIPACKNLPAIYDYAAAHPLCSIPIMDGAIFGIARTPPNPWSCNLGTGAGNDGVICRW